MIRARLVLIALGLALAGCGQKGDLRLPAAKTQPAQPQAAPAAAAPAPSTPAPASPK
ncbi:MAG TPA: lipoprotein [Usitatibacter sp.]|jgi:predicted small lipoprotein YifL|nr:lipoprotein [Usitatibacter sp.]